MKSKLFAGLILALVLGACPVLSSFTSALSLRGEHSCCPSDKSGKDQNQSAPANGDCCLRAPAHAQAFVVAPEFHVVIVALTSGPVLSETRRVYALDSSGASPPLEETCVRSSSPRAPPAVPA